MRTHTLLTAFICLSLGLAFSACGGAGTPDAEAPAADAPADDKGGDEGGGGASGADEKEEAKGDGSMEPPDKPSASQLVLEGDTGFIFSFKDSEIGEKKEKACDKQAKDDPQKKAKCMAKARKQIIEEGLRFIKDDEGNWWWVVFGLKGGKHYAIHRIQVEKVEKETETSLTLKLTGRDHGRKPMRAVPSTLEIQVPNEYSIFMDDPVMGKKVYKLRVGMAPDDD
jgi:hypothetical protein